MSPTVSIIMNCLNSARYLREALDSVAAQTFTDWELIFWDNCSTDASASIAMEYGSRIKVIQELEQTIPLGEARNYALKHATGRYIAFLDCDDIWMPNHLETQVTYLEKHPKVGFSYSNFECLNERNNSLKVVFKKPQPSGRIFEKALGHYPIGILSVVMRRSLLTALDHWFDPTLNLVEDYDFFLRVVHITQAKYHHDVLSRYRNHGSNTTNQNASKFPGELMFTLNKFRSQLSLTRRERRIIKNEYRYQLFRHHLHAHLKTGHPIRFLLCILRDKALPIRRVLSVLLRRRKGGLIKKIFVNLRKHFF